MVKENRIENCSQCQENMNLNLQLIPYVEGKYWREDHGKRATQQGFVLKIFVWRTSHHFTEQDSATKRNHNEWISPFIMIFINITKGIMSCSAG